VEHQIHAPSKAKPCDELQNQQKLEKPLAHKREGGTGGKLISKGGEDDNRRKFVKINARDTRNWGKKKLRNAVKKTPGKKKKKKPIKKRGSTNQGRPLRGKGKGASTKRCSKKKFGRALFG